MNNFSIGSLFDGIGAVPLAGRYFGFTPAWASEILPCAVSVTKRHFPDMTHLGDITKLDGSKLPPVDVIAFGSPCFPSGTLIMTVRGSVPIEEIVVGDKVLSHTGKWRKVTAVGSKTAATIVLKGHHYGLETTREHPIYSAEIKKSYPRNGGSRSIVKRLTNVGQWTPARDMYGKKWATPCEVEYLPFPRPEYYSKRQKKLPAFDANFFYFIGRWLGNGWVRNDQRSNRPDGQYNGQIFLCDSFDKEDEIIAAVAPLTDNYSVFRENTVVKVRFNSTALCEWLIQHFGKGAAGKTIPSWVFSLPIEYRHSIMRGIENSDGHRVSDNQILVTTVSKKLAFGLRTLGETLGYSTGVQFCRRNPTCVIDGRTVNQRNTYTVRFYNGKRRFGISHNSHSWYSCKSIVETGETKRVFNLSVDVDESYVADSIVVHNCQSFSIAGTRTGFGGKSGLFMEAIRIIREMRLATNGAYPKICLFENVPGLFSCGKGSYAGSDYQTVLEAFCESEIPMPKSGRWSNAGMVRGRGFNLAWIVKDAAKHYRVPQRRRRLFVVVDFTDAGNGAAEILFKPRSLQGYFATREREREGTAAYSESSTYGAGGGINATRDESEIIVAASTQVNAEILKDLSPTLKVQHGQPYICAAFMAGQAKNARSIAYNESVAISQSNFAPVLGVHQNQSGEIGVSNTAYTLSASSNASARNAPLVAHPNIAGTICASGAGLNRPAGQGNETDLVVAYSIAGDVIGRADKNGGNGFGMNKEILPTLNAADKHALAANLQVGNDCAGNYIVRRLTPLECERLMSLPDGWTEYGYDGKQMSDTSRYQMCGNSIVVNVLAYIMQNIASYLI